MSDILKNIKKAEILKLKDQIEYHDGQVVSKTLAQNEAVSITVFSFDKNEEISSHKSGGDALLTVIDGCAKITIDDNFYELCEGESIVMPAGHPHAVFAKEKMKMFLAVVF